MTKQYIDRTALLRQAETLFDGQREVMGVKAEHIYSAPLEDVAEVVHGEWVKKHRHRGGYRTVTGVDSMGVEHTITIDERYETDDLYCSVCGKLSSDVSLNFCSNCGAKMDGGERE